MRVDDATACLNFCRVRKGTIGPRKRRSLAPQGRRGRRNSRNEQERTASACALLVLSVTSVLCPVRRTRYCPSFGLALVPSDGLALGRFGRYLGHEVGMSRLRSPVALNHDLGESVALKHRDSLLNMVARHAT